MGLLTAARSSRHYQPFGIPGRGGAGFVGSLSQTLRRGLRAVDNQSALGITHIHASGSAAHIRNATPLFVGASVGGIAAPIDADDGSLAPRPARSRPPACVRDPFSFAQYVFERHIDYLFPASEQDPDSDAGAADSFDHAGSSFHSPSGHKRPPRGAEPDHAVAGLHCGPGSPEQAESPGSSSP